MANRTGRAAVCVGGAVLALALGIGGVGLPRTNAAPAPIQVVPALIAAPAPIAAPTPASPDGVCCNDAVQAQASGSDCIIGLNCGQIRPRPRRTAPAPLPPPPPQQ